MRQFINIVGDFLREAPQTVPFALPPALKAANYEMPGNLSVINRWRAMTYKANSGGDVGKMDDVGYVMISLKDNTIIPIARGDEHNTGYDMLWSMRRKFKIDPEAYRSIWAHGNNYIYDLNEVPDLLVAARKFLSYGGIDGPLKGSNDLSGKIVTLSHFVQSDGNFTIKPKHLAPVGQVVIKAYQTLEVAKEAARVSVSKALHNKAFLAADAMMAVLNRFALVLGIYGDLDKTAATLKEVRVNDDINGLDQLFFGFHSIKNKMHNDLRACQKRVLNGEKPEWDDQKIVGVWGDLDQAVDMLGRF